MSREPRRDFTSGEKMRREEKRREGKRGLPEDRRQVVYYMGENRRLGRIGNRNRRNTAWDPLSERDKLRVLLS